MSRKIKWLIKSQLNHAKRKKFIFIVPLSYPSVCKGLMLREEKKEEKYVNNLQQNS